MLVIPKGLETQKDRKSKIGSQIVPPPLKQRRHLNGQQQQQQVGGDAIAKRPRLTVTELQKHPFARGSYAGRLIELMQYHRSEYAMWANATIREMGSTEPMAVIEILTISRNMNLQWARCKVIFSNKTKRPFELARTRTSSRRRDRDPTRDTDRIESTPPREIGPKEEPGRTATWSGMDNSLDVRGIGDNDGESTSSSGPGHSRQIQVRGKQLGSEWRVLQDLRLRGLQQVSTHGGLPTLSKNTQGSEGGGFDGQDQEFSLTPTLVVRGVGLSINSDMAVDTPCFKGSLAAGDITLADKIEDDDMNDRHAGAEEVEDENMEIDETKDKRTMGTEMQDDEVQDRTRSVVSSIDNGSSSGVGGSQALVPINPMRTAGRRQQETTLSMAAEAGPTLDIIFSNLFNHSTLKVADRVEIHEPCRPVALLGSDESGAEVCVWIVERYAVG
ncbi:hypothetical protein BGX29_007478 [Mortierella sp. GBA35]|nr:hypothetical protein BGX29_007478 [Mortierella sp. GBA35]